jgi:hypothetical protein
MILIFDQWIPTLLCVNTSRCSTSLCSVQHRPLVLTRTGEAQAPVVQTRPGAVQASVVLTRPGEAQAPVAQTHPVASLGPCRVDNH